MVTPQYELDASALVDHVHSIGRCVIAFSGGVDSAVVAAAACRADRLRRITMSRGNVQWDRGQTGSIAVTADSPSVSREQFETAVRVAAEIGIRHQIVCTDEIDREDYRVNDRRRCFHCKQTLYATLKEFARSNQIPVLLSGTNADDLGDYRPGIEAGNLAGVAVPLAVLGLTKDRVRGIANHWKISIFDRPAQPCLSSRIAYGVRVTSERLRRIELAEQFLRTRHYSPLRVRLLENEEARIEVAIDEIDRLCQPDQWRDVTDYLLSLEFRSVSVDSNGFRSGSMNELVQLAMRPKTT